MASFLFVVNKCSVDLSDLGTKRKAVYPLPLSVPRSSQGFVIHTCTAACTKLLLPLLSKAATVWNYVVFHNVFFVSTSSQKLFRHHEIEQMVSIDFN